MHNASENKMLSKGGTVHSLLFILITLLLNKLEQVIFMT